MKKLKLSSLFILLVVLVNSVKSQDIDEFQWFGDDYEDELYLGLGISGISLSNNEAPNPNNHKLSGLVFRIDMRKTNFEKGGLQVHFENKLLGDLVHNLVKISKGEGDIYENESSGLTTGLLGWWSFLINLTEPNKYQISAGVNLNDYFLTAAYPEDISKPYSNVNNSITQEPNGYYFGMGPAASFTYSVNSLLMLQYHTALSIPYFRVEAEDLVESPGGYKMPYFFNHKIEAITSKGFFGGLELSNIMNRGNLPNSTVRKEWYFGFRIMM